MFGKNRKMNRLLIILMLPIIIVVGCWTDKGEPYNYFEIYYQDSLDLSKYIGNKNLTIRQTESIFGVKDQKLFVKNYNAVDRVMYDVEINGNYCTIKLKFWIDNKYRLEEVNYDNKLVLLTQKDTTFYMVGQKLYYSVGNMSQPIFCALIAPPDMMYNEMISDYGVYAIRLNNSIYVSCDLKKWHLVYQNMRGIKQSMVIVENKVTGHIELLFSEYTPGTARPRHHVQKYDYKTDSIKTIFTFYTTKEHVAQGLAPFARHIHSLVQDPYTGDIYVCSGDTDDESSIFVSSDGGKEFRLLGKGSQSWRALSFIFTEKSVFWNVDSHETQYLRCVSRDEIIGTGPLSEKSISNFPLINSALWCTIPTQLDSGDNMYIMGSNNEGGLYDDQCRTYGIIFKNDIPVVYELLKMKARSVYTQMFPIGVDNENCFYFCDHEVGKMYKYKLAKIQ